MRAWIVDLGYFVIIAAGVLAGGYDHFVHFLGDVIAILTR